MFKRTTQFYYSITRQIEIKGSSLRKAVVEMREKYKREKEVFTEDTLISNQKDYHPTKLTGRQRRENGFLYDIETYPVEENDACVPY